jgi:hypothetical protein
MSNPTIDACVYAEACALIDHAIRERFGFLSLDEIRQIARVDSLRLQQILVRCGACRFRCAAQDAAHLTAIIEADGRDYIRDYSIPVHD